MTRQLAGAVGLAVVLAMVGLTSAVFSGIEGTAGQINFVPVPEVDESVAGTGPMMEVQSCEPGPAGLTVTGHVDPSRGNPVIVVSRGEERQPGARVGMAHAMDAAPGEFDELGDFRVVIPWATGDSTFAVQVRKGAGEHGPIVRCPEAANG